MFSVLGKRLYESTVGQYFQHIVTRRS